MPDYAMSHELLLFQYDRWLFKTVTGAINSARVLKCSPLRALDTKTFSPGYWQWQHRFLLDAVSQFGLPSLFLTISPYEWTFPFPLWLEEVREKTELGPTRIPCYETIHIANTLEQLVVRININVNPHPQSTCYDSSWYLRSRYTLPGT